MNELARTGPGAAAAPAVLGKDRALAPNGAVGQKKTVQLWEQQGHIFWTGSKPVKTKDANGNVIDKWMSVYSLDIKGLDLLNQTAGCTVIPAPFLVVDGRECENPRIIRGENNQPAEVISKYVCFGLSKTGQKGAIRYGIAHGIPGSLSSILGVPIYTVKAVSARKAILGKPNGWTKPKIEKAVMPLIEGFKQETSQNRRWGVSDAALCALYSQHHPVASAILEVSHGRKPGSSARSLRHQQCLFGG
ncbi:MAG: hypothetical protein DWQ01_08745 [Planctomycetota bacterium]|nr:MAG: hypothetical protein DWQ01_08745 [Planctomycetota bacterium]